MTGFCVYLPAGHKCFPANDLKRCNRTPYGVWNELIAFRSPTFQGTRAQHYDRI